jgi:hypothetical protein
MNLPLCCPLAIALMAVGSAVAAPPLVPLRAVDGPLVALWQKAANPNKPYVAQLFAPGDKPLPLLDDSPPDHFHHHGLMFALGADDTDFWTEQGVANAGRQEVADAVSAPAGDGFTQSLRWLATDGTHLLDESRRVRVRATGKGADAVHWLDWQSTLTPAAGREAVRLTGQHYFGLGLRFLPAWANKGEFVWPATSGQAVVRGDEKLSPGPWAAVRCVVDGRTVTVLMIESRANSRATRWFTMNQPFCYLSAALGLEVTPARLAAGERWTLCYGLAVLSGPADATRLAKLAADWQASTPFPTNEQPRPPKP